MSQKQLIVIGAGPGGYTAAFLAADLGMEVTLIHEYERLGGVCLNAGCIPAKTLLHAAKTITQAKDIENYGITFSSPQINIEKLREQKNSVITKLTTGLMHLCKQRKIHFIVGHATFKDDKTLLIQKPEGSQETLPFENVIIATGSKPKTIPHLPASDRIMDSPQALEVTDIPKTLLVLGGGYIGLEFGSIYAALGCEVTVVEMTDHILPGTDTELIRPLLSKLKKRFKTIKTNTKVTHMEEKDNSLSVVIENKKGNIETLHFDKALIAIGRKPRTSDLGLENTQIEKDNNGAIKVDDHGRTNHPNIYAIGDVIAGPMLAHKASYEARVAVKSLLGKEASLKNKLIPAVVFTDPEIATCGLTETQAKENDIEITVVTFPWAASGRALTLDKPEGFTKLLIDPSTEKILGLAIVGMGAGELIAEGVVAIENGLKASDLKNCTHPHPTLSESIMECAKMYYGECVNLACRK